MKLQIWRDGLKKYEKMKWNEVWKWEILETGLIQLWYNYEYRLGAWGL